jgi:hypothetical protein
MGKVNSFHQLDFGEIKNARKRNSTTIDTLSYAS